MPTSATTPASCPPSSSARRWHDSACHPFCPAAEAILGLGLRPRATQRAGAQRGPGLAGPVAWRVQRESERTPGRGLCAGASPDASTCHVGPGALVHPYDRLVHSYGKSFADGVRMWMRHVPSAPDWVAFPRNEDELIDVLDWAHEQRVAVIPFGGVRVWSAGWRHRWGWLSSDPVARHGKV